MQFALLEYSFPYKGVRDEARIQRLRAYMNQQLRQVGVGSIRVVEDAMPKQGAVRAAIAVYYDLSQTITVDDHKRVHLVAEDALSRVGTVVESATVFQSSAGKRQTVGYGALGAATGLLAGAVLADSGSIDTSDPNQVLLGHMALAALGGVLGAAVGSLLDAKEWMAVGTWQRDPDTGEWAWMAIVPRVAESMRARA